MSLYGLKKGCVLGAVSAITLLLGACGGGGGSGGSNPNQPYDLTLRAETRADGTPKVELPLNLMHVGPNISAKDGPFTTALYIDAITANRPVPSGDFACAIVEGLEVGALYYLNGEDPKDENDNIMASRSIVLGANSGSASFHFHASNSAGTAKIRCTLENNQDRVAEISIKVGDYGGNPSGSYIETTEVGGMGYMLTQNVVAGTTGITKQLTMQSSVFDDFGQPVSKPTGNNVRVTILPTSAAGNGASLRAGGTASGKSILVPTVTGRATYTVVSGNQPGRIDLLVEADRADNNVDNGIQEAVTHRAVVWALDHIPDFTAPSALVFEDATYTAHLNRPFSEVLNAAGGIPPYLWSVGNGTLPAGLTLGSNGVISGTPTTLGSNRIKMVVSDSAANTFPFPANQRVTANITINVEPYDSGLAIVCTGGAEATDTCAMANASVGIAYLQALSAKGGTGTYTWSVSELPSFLSFDATNAQIRSNRALTCDDLNVTVTTTNPEPPATPVTTTTYTDRGYGFLVTLTSGTESISTMARFTLNRNGAVCN
ncbi:hypothetical protein E9531_10450 [Lampropedia puyangensis]|uniref:Uncharacterized protein n=1 Tax=Lampropedia puyangensis TaxID=1330072 RepID=A0A4S8F183_9BURK|nr:Ig domain-containing protein [Lampropedia puyangensis]THU00679.1 hypothetical protein E9531_10450 [Lampropedia puyangensis]